MSMHDTDRIVSIFVEPPKVAKASTSVSLTDLYRSVVVLSCVAGIIGSTFANVNTA